MCRVAGVRFLCKFLGVQVLPMLLLSTPHSTTPNFCDMLKLVVSCQVAGVLSCRCEALLRGGCVDAGVKFFVKPAL